ncbi:MAG: hypothetical protein JWL69_3632 [Phycisphaerales bacterium]|nr:hypothetical protein [Phycisphaerales bacterium]
MSQAIKAILTEMSLNRERMETAKVGEYYALCAQQTALGREVGGLPWDDEDQDLVRQFEKGEFVGTRPKKHAIRRKG